MAENAEMAGSQQFHRLMRETLVAVAACSVSVVVCYYFVDRPVAYFVHDHQIARFDELRWLTEPPPLVQLWAPLVLTVLVVRRTLSPWGRWQHVLFLACVSSDRGRSIPRIARRHIRPLLARDLAQ